MLSLQLLVNQSQNPVVHIETIDLSSREVILPGDRVGMVVVQPFLNLTATEPFLCTPDSKKRQLAVLQKTIAVSLAKPHGAEKTHFTIFPEYSICGPDGIGLIQMAMESAEWPPGTVTIGGTDALSKSEFVAIAGAQRTHLNTTGNALDRINETSWVNCNITWIKGVNGTVERWLQPKLEPAWPEQNISYQQMFKGNSIFAFRGPFQNGTQYRFCSLVCFDWIGSIENKKIWQWVVEDLHNQAMQAQAEYALSWFFVIQSNDKPSHNTFLMEVQRFFDQTTLPNARRERACLVFANGAGKAELGRSANYGQTSLVFSPQALFAQATCSPTFSSGAPSYRSSTLLNGYHDVVFRERGACIHSFLQINPGSLAPGPAGRKVPLENAFVFSLQDEADRRAPSGPVPASIKWINDELDEVRCLSEIYPEAPLATQVRTSHTEMKTALRQITPQATAHTIKLASQKSDAKNEDAWGETESKALEHLVHTLDIIKLGSGAVSVGNTPVHAKASFNGWPLDIIAINGESHESCRIHSEKIIAAPRTQTLLISRDEHNNPWLKRFGSFLQTEQALGEEPKITDPASGLLHVGFRNLLDVFQRTNNPEDVPGAINAALSA